MRPLHTGVRAVHGEVLRAPSTKPSCVNSGTPSKRTVSAQILAEVDTGVVNGAKVAGNPSIPGSPDTWR